MVLSSATAQAACYVNKYNDYTCDEGSKVVIPKIERPKRELPPISTVVDVGMPTDPVRDAEGRPIFQPPKEQQPATVNRPRQSLPRPPAREAADGVNVDGPVAKDAKPSFWNRVFRLD